MPTNRPCTECGGATGHIEELTEDGLCDDCRTSTIATPDLFDRLSLLFLLVAALWVAGIAVATVNVLQGGY